jgi:hypothetical protein
LRDELYASRPRRNLLTVRGLVAAQEENVHWKLRSDPRQRHPLFLEGFPESVRKFFSLADGCTVAENWRNGAFHHVTGSANR